MLYSSRGGRTVAKIDNYEVYTDVVKSLVTEAANNVEGIEVIDESKNVKGRSFRGQGVSVYLMPDDKATIDIFANIYLGYNVPDVVAMVQEAAKKAVEAATRYTVTSINVQVVSVIFPPNN